jgi:hypothetical protein
MGDKITTNIYVDRFRSKIRAEAVDKFDQLDENFKLLYTTEQCQMCGAHLTVRQMNRVIIQGVPPVCMKDYKKLQGAVAQLAPLFDQLRLL